MRAIFRRAEALGSATDDGAGDRLVRGELEIHVPKRWVRLRREAVDLTAREFDLLCHFARHPGRVYSRVQLLDEVWGYGHDGYEHTVNSHINRLRAKIESDPRKPEFILTVWGVGYKFNDALPRAADARMEAVST